MASGFSTKVPMQFTGESMTFVTRAVTIGGSQAERSTQTLTSPYIQNLTEIGS